MAEDASYAGAGTVVPLTYFGHDWLGSRGPASSDANGWNPLTREAETDWNQFRISTNISFNDLLINLKIVAHNNSGDHPVEILYNLNWPTLVTVTPEFDPKTWITGFAMGLEGPKATEYEIIYRGIFSSRIVHDEQASQVGSGVGRFIGPTNGDSLYQVYWRLVHHP